MTVEGPVLELNNGVGLPAVGLGVYRAGPEETAGAVTAALRTGYRMIDTAAAYFNEAQVGAAIRDSGVPRPEIFVQTKAWISDYGEREIVAACERSLGKLGLESIDLYLLHQPAPAVFDRVVAAWKGLERLLAEGRVRAIGVCNFSVAHLERLMAAVEVVPAVNQVELHPFFSQPGLRAAHARLGIVTQAWSPIGGVNRYWGTDIRPENDPLTHPAIVALAEKHGGPRPRSSCAGSSSSATRSSRSRSDRPASRRTSTSSASRSATPTSPPSRPSTPAAAAAPTRTPCPASSTSGGWTDRAADARRLLSR